jgi:Caspase domain
MVKTDMIRTTCAILLIGVISFVSEAQQAAPRGDPRSFALVVGVGAYRDRAATPLAYAADDAVAVGVRLAEYGYEVTTLVDRNATREGIFRAASALRERLRPFDRVVIYFAGHALLSPRAKEPLLVTYDTELAYPEARAIRLAELTDIFRIEGSRVLYLLDHSFLSDAKGPGFDLKMAYYLYEDLRYNALERSQGGQSSVVVLTTLTARRPVLPDKRQGAFAAAVLEALGSNVADGNRDGHLTAAELVDFTRYETRSLTSGMNTEPLEIAAFVVGHIDDFSVVDFASDPTRVGVAELEFATKQRDLHSETLQRLSDSKGISLRTRLFTQALLDRWVDSLESDEPLTGDEGQSLEEVLSILGSPYGDRDKAEMLEDFQNYVQQPLQAPGNLSIK